MPQRQRISNLVVVLAATAVCLTTTIYAQTVRLGKPTTTDTFESARYTGPGENFLQNYMRESAERQFGNANLVVLSDRFYGIERYEATAFDLMLEGASAGATLGLFAGAVANTAGFWEEDTSWYIMGAAAAVGALLGYTNADDPGKRARYRWRLGVDAQDR